MANEITLAEGYGPNRDGEQRNYTIATGTAVSKGTLLALGTPATVTAALSSSTFCAGVAAEEHPANLGVTHIAVWTQGIINVVASGAIPCGESVRVAETNMVRVCGNNAASGAMVLGYALQDIADLATGEVRLNL